VRVDHKDDGICRYVVFHYRYDPERHERRNVLVVAFDDSDEMVEYIQGANATLKNQQANGLVDPREHFHGTSWPAGSRERTRRERIELRRRRRNPPRKDG
jgi:hypothetical protein